MAHLTAAKPPLCLKQKRVLAGAIISLFFLSVCFSSQALADCQAGATCSNHNWRLIVGGQYTHRSPSVYYLEKDNTPLREVFIEEDFTEKRYLPFPFMKLEYQINPVSFVDLTYNRDETKTSALQRKTVNFLFFPIRLAIRAPLEVNTQSLKLRYNRALYQTQDWQIGAALGINVLKFDAEAQIPGEGKKEDSFTAPLPNFGLFAVYQPMESINLKFRTDYLPLKTGKTDGTLSETELALEYQYNETWFLGAGYRYSYFKLALNHDSYNADIKHITYGPTVFVGVNF